MIILIFRRKIQLWVSSCEHPPPTHQWGLPCIDIKPCLPKPEESNDEEINDDYELDFGSFAGDEIASKGRASQQNLEKSDALNFKSQPDKEVTNNDDPPAMKPNLSSGKYQLSLKQKKTGALT